QVATDLALFVRAHADQAVIAAGRLAETLADLAEAHLDWPMPGYTHLQRAQPVYLSHHLLAYVWMLVRDRERFGAVVQATGSLPLGPRGRRSCRRRRIRTRPSCCGPRRRASPGT